MKALLIATVQSHVCQFHRSFAAMLREHGYEVHVAARNNLAEKNGLELDFVDRVFDVPFQRSPISRKNLDAYCQLNSILSREGYDLVICNTPVGGMLGRLAARTSRRHGTRVIYIAHGFHFYKGAPKKNWLLYYPLEREMARLCDVVVTINEEDFRFASRHFPGKVARLHGVGVREDRYHPAPKAEQIEMRRKEGLTEEDFVVICTGELNENKNQKTLIAAAALLKERLPTLRLLLAGNGPTEQALRDQIDANGLENVVKLLGYRTDLETVVPAVDVVASCSKREGLPLNIVEAMLCKKPVVASVNRGNAELVEDGKTGYLLAPEDAEGFAERIHRLSLDKRLAEDLGECGYQKAQAYTVRAVCREYEKILFGE